MATKKGSEQIQYGDFTKEIHDQEQTFKPTTFRVPDGMSVFKFKKAVLYNIDVIPYCVTGDRDLMTSIGGAKGRYMPSRRFIDHGNVGVEDRRYCCLGKEMWGERCPVCEKLVQMRNDPQVIKMDRKKAWNEILSAFAPKTRRLFYLYVHEEPDLGVQIHECSQYAMGKSFYEALENRISAIEKKRADDPRLQFYRVDERGYTLEVNCEQDTFNGRPFAYPAAISDFVKRASPLDRDLYKDLPSLDDLLIKTPYKELKKIFLQGGGTANDEDDDTSAKNGRGVAKGRRPEPREDEDDDDQDEDETDDDKNEDEEEQEEDEAEDRDEDDDDEDAQEEETEEDVEGDDDGDEESGGDSEDGDDEDESGDEDSDEDEEGPPAKKKPVKTAAKKKDVTAQDRGIALKMKVRHPEHGLCTVVHISPDGTSLRIVDVNDDDKIHRFIAPEDLEIVEDRPAKKKGTKPTRGGSRSA
jgi:hypothetical protein